MDTLKSFIVATVTISLALGFASAPLAADPAVICEASKLKESGKYSLCRMKVDSKVTRKGGSADYTKCDSKIGEKFTKAEAKSGETCPTSGVATIQSLVTQATGEWGAEIAGEPGSSSTLPATGQASCTHPSGTSIPCGGTGYDGQVRAGQPLSFFDNGDGTITDNVTHLMWQKQSGGSLDVTSIDFTYTWDDAFGVHLNMLNNTCANSQSNIVALVDCSVGGDSDCSGVGGPCGFAGYRDWRIPNVRELFSIVDFSGNVGNPSTRFVAEAFNVNCDMGDGTPLTESCTEDSFYYTSTQDPYAGPLSVNSVYWVDFADGQVESSVTWINGAPVESAAWVRAVRGGLPPREGKVVFATEATYTGDLGGLAGADAECADAAVAAGLEGTFLPWIALAGDAASAPATRFTQSAGPYVLVENTLVANDWADLTDGTLNAPINVTENGNPVTGDAWTNVEFDGTTIVGSVHDCQGWTYGLGAFNGVMGLVTSQDGHWSFDQAQLCFGTRRLYCFEQ